MPPPPAVEPGAPLGEVSAAIAGTATVDVDLAPPGDLAASVALIRSGNDFGRSNCSGTLIDRDLIVTAADCLYFGNPPALYDPADIEVSFSAAGAVFAVSQVNVIPTGTGKAANDGIAMLRLVSGVPRSIVESTPPVYLRDVSTLMADRAFADPIIMGFGCTTTDAVCTFARRKGTPWDVHLQVRIGAQNVPQHVLASWGFYPPERTAPVNHDLGGPLFMFDVASARWVLAGVLTHIWIDTWINADGSPGYDYVGPSWDYLGNVGTNGIDGHAHLVRPYLGPDVDDDGIHDHFDNCPPSECVAANLAVEICANADQASALGGMGDACAFADSRLEFDLNSNIEVEVDLQVMEVPDQFDPVPLMRLESDPNLVEVTGSSAASLWFRAATWLGNLTEQDRDGGYIDDDGFKEKIGFRFCSCYDPYANVHLEEACLAEGICIPSEAVDAAFGASFKEILVLDYTTPETINGTSKTTRTFSELTAGEPLDLVWGWHDDWQSGWIQGEIVDLEDRQIAMTYGFLASAVVHNQQRYTSVRDYETNGQLRADLLVQTLPELSNMPIEPDLPHYYVTANPCVLFDCHFPIHWPLEEYLHQYSGVVNLINKPMVVLNDPERGLPFASTVWQGEPYRIEFGEYVPDIAVWTFPDAETPWLHISQEETMASVQGMGIDSRAMLLAPAGTEAARAYRVVSDEDDGYLVPNAGVPWGAASAPSDRVEMPAGGKAVYSATRNELLLVGGSDLTPGIRVRRYLPDSNKLEVVPVAALWPGDQVFGATFDHAKNVLYVLDLDPNSDGMDARIVAHDLEEGTSRQLWVAPYSGIYPSMDLAMRGDRQLVLSVTDGDTWTAWSIDPRAHRARFTGRVDGQGQPVNALVMGVHALTIPVLQPNGIHFEHLPVERFQEGVACTGL